MSLFKAFLLKTYSVLDANIQPYRQDPTESSNDFALDGVEHILEPGQGSAQQHGPNTCFQCKVSPPS